MHVMFFVITSQLTDINECEEGISGCSQLCNNTVGGYFCSCMAGYSLLEDGRNCVGKHVQNLIARPWPTIVINF